MRSSEAGAGSSCTVTVQAVPQVMFIGAAMLEPFRGLAYSQPIFWPSFFAA